MAFKINISDKGKTMKLETDSEELAGKKIGETIQGHDINAELNGYVLEITGTSDKSGFPGKKDVEGANMKKVLLTKGFGLHTKPKGLSKTPIKFPEGLRMKKTIRGNLISPDTVQINMKVITHGHKKFEEMLPKKEAKAEAPAAV